MKKRFNWSSVQVFRFWLFTVLSFFAMPLSSPVFAEEPTKAQIAVVTHLSVSTEQLSRLQLRKIFSMRQPKWPDGQGMKVFVLNSKHQTHIAFCKSLLKMFPYQLEQFWNKLTYSGLGDPPIVVANMEEMLMRVRQTPGAIGYVYEDMQTNGVGKIKVSER